MTDQAESMIREVMASDAYHKATATLAAEHDRTIEDIVTLTQIAAPSFQEAVRARAFLKMDATRIVTRPLIPVAAHIARGFPRSWLLAPVT